MNILEYGDVDPVQVLHLSMLALDFPLTPERAAHIRRTDPRPLPCFTVNAVEGGTLLGQAGVFRLPMISAHGREDVGGIWAVAIHPGHAGRGIVSTLLEAAHIRMRESGLRFSTLGANRYRSAYDLYQHLGYEDVQVYANALATWETAHQPTRLSAKPPEAGGYEFVEQLFTSLSEDYLGFAWRHAPFEPLKQVRLEEIWILWENGHPVGYAFVCPNPTLLTISHLALKTGVDASEAIAAIAAELKSVYVQVDISRPVEMASLRRAGYRVAHPSRDAFMIKPLIPEVTVEEARRLFGIGTDRFLISRLDVTY